MYLPVGVATFKTSYHFIKKYNKIKLNDHRVNKSDWYNRWVSVTHVLTLVHVKISEKQTIERHQITKQERASKQNINIRLFVRGANCDRLRSSDTTMNHECRSRVQDSRVTAQTARQSSASAHLFCTYCFYFENLAETVSKCLTCRGGIDKYEDGACKVIFM